MNEFECPLNQPVYAVMRVSYTDVGLCVKPDIIEGELREINEGSGTPVFRRFLPYTKKGKVGSLQLHPSRFCFFTDKTAAEAFAYAERMRCVEELKEMIKDAFPDFQEARHEV